MDRYHTPRERLLAVFEGQGELFAQPGYRGCAFARASAESHPGDLVEQATEAYRRWVRALLTELAARQARPTPRPWPASCTCCTTAAARPRGWTTTAPRPPPPAPPPPPFSTPPCSTRPCPPGPCRAAARRDGGPAQRVTWLAATCPGSVLRRPSRPAVVVPLKPRPARCAHSAALMAAGSAGR